MKDETSNQTTAVDEWITNLCDSMRSRDHFEAAACVTSIITCFSGAQHRRLTIALQEHRLRLLQLAIEECLRAIEAK